MYYVSIAFSFVYILLVPFFVTFVMIRGIFRQERVYSKEQDGEELERLKLEADNEEKYVQTSKLLVSEFKRVSPREFI